MCGRITTNAVNWAAANEVVSGYGNGRFGVNDNVTRQDVAAILCRQEGRPAANAQDFVDESSIASYTATAEDWARSNGIISGKGGNRFEPWGNAIRAETATMIKNYIEYTESAEPTLPTPSGNKTLVVYFSATGSTERVAGYITDELDADTFELIPSNPYTSEDLNWTRVNREHEDESLWDIDLVADTVENWDDCDTVFIGYSIWWGIAAWPVNNFITANGFTGKKCMLNAYDHLSSKDSIAYEEPQGFSGLRHILGSYLYLLRGVKCSAEQIILTSGHQQSMHIIANLFRPADWGFAMEDPGYSGTRQVMEQSNFHVTPVPVENEGISIAAIQNLSLHFCALRLHNTSHWEVFCPYQNGCSFWNGQEKTTNTL